MGRIHLGARGRWTGYGMRSQAGDWSRQPPSNSIRPGGLFRIVYGDGSGLADRLGPINDLLIALTARQIGATVVTNNLNEFRRIAEHVPGLAVVAPGEGS